MNNVKNGTGDKVLDVIIYIGAVMMFAKTADVLSFYSPRILNDILGFDVSSLFGMLSAFLVEGTAIALHINRRGVGYPPAIAVKSVLLGVSGLCQVFDGYLTTGQAAQMSETLKALLTYGVPNIPLIVLALIFAIGRLPEDGSERRPFVGLKNLPSHFSWVWHGEKSVGKPPVPTLGALAKNSDLQIGDQSVGKFSMGSLVNDLDLLKPPDESVGKSSNPTNGKVK